MTEPANCTPSGSTGSSAVVEVPMDSRKQTSEMRISEHLQSNYEDYYDDGVAAWRRLGAIGKADNIVSLCSDLPRSSILEIGAGEGSILQRLSELNFGDELYALEISPSGIEAIKHKEIPRLADCQIFDGYHVPYGDNRFDIAILTHVIEHVEHPRILIYEAARVAKYVFIEVPLEDTIRLPRDFVFDKVGHINSYSQKTIRRLVQSCNLRVLRQQATNPSKAAHTFQKGYKRWIGYHVKQVLIKTMPTIATELFTYHAALLCEKNVS
jgi:ubiquinone/menaquinone biosynthesis C-methylase UbiE